MVVLESGGMITTGSNQYLQPDYLSPLPTTLEVSLAQILLYIQVVLLQLEVPMTGIVYPSCIVAVGSPPGSGIVVYPSCIVALDAKKSPLALLAQTCSQIGADSPNTKTLIPTLEKPSKKSSSVDTSVSPPVSVHKAPPPAQPLARTSPSEPRLAFKPYETNVLCKKMTSPPVEERPPSKTGSVNDSGEKGGRASSRKSAASPSVAVQLQGDVGKTPSGERVKSVSPSNTGGASPIIRSGLEVLQGHPKDMPLGTYKPSGLGGLGGSLGSLCSGCPPGLEPNNPAFRPPFAGGPFSHHHAALLAAGYPSASPGPYVSYARVKTASGGEALVPVCKDPYCTGCQYSLHNQQLLLGSCPSGCTQCDHQKYNLAAALSGLVPQPPPHLAYRPYVCNWIAGDSYCGKRFGTSDELLQHLRTHTTAADNSMSLLNPHALPCVLSRRSASRRLPEPSSQSSVRQDRSCRSSLNSSVLSLSCNDSATWRLTSSGPCYTDQLRSLLHYQLRSLLHYQLRRLVPPVSPVCLRPVRHVASCDSCEQQGDMWEYWVLVQAGGESCTGWWRDLYRLVERLGLVESLVQAGRDLYRLAGEETCTGWWRDLYRLVKRLVQAGRDTCTGWYKDLYRLVERLGLVERLVQAGQINPGLVKNSVLPHETRPGWIVSMT
uniref:C2H2-type domain-containing protein n=1 Tax=Timema genevievae TaxID=629358 RepID=A0A7R9PQI6_TIMGE|nr:unnamed protein product [Timema genevievae]